MAGSILHATFRRGPGQLDVAPAPKTPVPTNALSAKSASVLSRVQADETAGTPQVLPEGPTSGPQDLDIPFVGPACLPGDGQDWNVEILVNGAQDPGTELGEWEDAPFGFGSYTLYGEIETGGDLWNYLPYGVSQISFECQVWDPTTPQDVTVLWTDPGFSVDITGENQPLDLSTYGPMPGQTIFSHDGAPSGEMACPSVAPYQYQSVEFGGDFPGDPGIMLGNLGSYDPSRPATEYALHIPDDLPLGGSYDLDADCFSYNSDGTYFAFVWNDASIQIGNPTAPDPTMDGGPLGAEETYGGNNPAEGACGCAEGWEGDPVNTADGDYSETDSDATVLSSGPGLHANRTYNSLAASTSGLFGHGWSFEYGAHLTIADSGTEVDVVQGDMATVGFTRPSTSQPFTPDAPRITATLSQNGDGTYTFTTISSTQDLSYRFSSSGQLQSISDPTGQTTTISYPSSNQLVVTDPWGRTLTYQLTNGLVTSLTDPMGNLTTYAYNASGDLIKVVDPLGRITQYGYDSKNRLVSRTDPDGGALGLTYDTSGRVATQTDPDGGTTSFDYTSIPNATQITDPDGNVVVDYYQDGFLVEEIQGYGTQDAATWQYQHDPSTGGITVTIDPNDNTTYRTFNALGEATTSTDELGAETQWTYNEMGEPTSETDPLGNTTAWSYDADGNLLTKSVPLAGGGVGKTVNTYGTGNQAGELMTSTDPDGNLTAYTYNSAGDMTAETLPSGAATTYTYDTNGERLSETAPDGGQTSYRYDADGELTTVTDNAGDHEAYTYNGEGLLATATNRDGDTTTYQYDANGNRKQVIQPNGSTQTLAYDADGNVTSSTDGNGNTTYYTYTALGQIASITNADQQATTFTYDGAGNLLTRTDAAGQETDFSYDGDNRLTGVAYSQEGTPSVEFTYNADGQRVQMEDGTGETTYAYTPAGALASETDGGGATITYGYDPAGNITSIVYPGGQTVRRTYDANGQLSSIQDWLGNTVHFGYDGDGNETDESAPGGVNESSTFDAQDEVDGISDTNADGTLATFNYSRDAAGAVTQATVQGDVTENEADVYDANGQLTGNGSTSDAYDPAGNATTYAGAAQTFDAADEIQTAASINPSLPTEPGTGTTTTTTTTTTTATGPSPTTTTAQATSPTTVSTGTTTTTTTSTGPHPHTSTRHTLTLQGSASTTGSRGHQTLRLRAIVRDPHSLLLAFVAMHGSASRQPATPGLHWRLQAKRADASGTVSIWSAFAPRDGPISLTIRNATADPSDVLAFAEFPSNTTVRDCSTASGRRSRPTVRCSGASGERVLAVGRATDWAGVPNVENDLAHAYERKSGDGGWVQTATVPTSRQVELRQTVLATGWLEAAVLVKASPATPGDAAQTVAEHKEEPTRAHTGHNRRANGTKAAPSPSNAAANSGPQTTFTYNADGDRTSATSSAGTTDLAYDQAGRLVSINDDISYAYNGNGLRMSKTVDGVTTPFTWDDSGPTAQLLQAGQTDYIYGPDGRPIEQITNGSPSFLLADQQGSTRLLTDASGTVVGTYSYDPWGNVTSHTGSSTALQYDGQYTDSETGFQYLRARYYDPTTGQFLTVDPLAQFTSLPYAFAGNDPTGLDDPTGLAAELCEGDDGFDPSGFLGSFSLYGGSAISAISELREMQGLDDIRGLDYAGDGFGYLGYSADGMGIGSDLAQGRYGDAALDTAFTGGDIAANAAKSSDTPWGYAAGVVIQTYTEDGRAAQQIDWSSKGMNEIEHASAGDWASAFGTAFSELPSHLLSIFSP